MSKDKDESHSQSGAYDGNGSLLTDSEYSSSKAARFENQGEIQYPFEDTSGTGDENKIRGNWTSKVDFFVLCLGFTVGFSNFWRFPYYCYIHGGSAFLFPYLLMLFFAGVPLFLMELSVGQFSSVGCITVWKVCPLFKGIGIAMFIVSCFIGIYNNVLIAWSIYYLIASMRSQVPWSSCDNHDWNTPNCTISSRNLLFQCTSKNGTLFRNGSCFINSVVISSTDTELLDINSNLNFSNPSLWPSSEFFYRQVLELSSDITVIGKIHWQLALYLLVAWVVVFFCLFKGIKSSGKVAYITTIMPYVVLFVLLVRALFLEGSFNGIIEFITPHWDRLLRIEVWGDAAAQVFYSLCSCWGGLITLASYNKFHSNCYKHTWIICFGNVLSSLFAGVVVFATLGHMAYDTNAPSVFEVLQKDVGVAFIVFSEAISRLPVAPVWAVLFFVMLIMLGIDSQIVAMETVVTAICDEFPERLRKNHRHVLSLFTVLFYACGVPFCTQAGLYFLQLFDSFAATWSLLIIGFFECMAIAWVYGVDNLLDNIKWMVGFYPKPYIFWKVIWIAVTPTLLMSILLYSWVFYENQRLGAPIKYAYPDWAIVVGWIISFISVSAIPITALVKFMKVKGRFSQRLRTLLSPEDDWGPALAVHRSEEYPLQIPEARDPIKMSLAERKRLMSDRSPVEVNGSAKLISNEMPHFDRETAI